MRSVPAADLPGYWRDNMPALLAFIDEVHNGVSGFVHSHIGHPLPDANITVEGIEHSVRTAKHGDYWRLLLPGTYNVTASKRGYESITERVTVPANGSVSLNFTLMADDPQHWSSAYDFRVLENIIGARYHYSAEVYGLLAELENKHPDTAQFRAGDSLHTALLHRLEVTDNGDPAKVWNFLRSLGVGKSRSQSIPKDLDLNLLNQHFTSSVAMDSATKTRTLNTLSSIPTPDFPEFNFSQFADSDVERTILAITSNAVGSDSISRKMVLPILDIILPVISHILNFSISTNTFPSTWKDAQVTPLPKKSNPSFSDYRPISILPFLSKVLERLVHHQLNRFLVRNDLMNRYQSGFRPGHSTVTALVKITDDVRQGMENGELTVLSLLDFSNAFNTVDFDILLGVLRSLNVSPTVIDWFHSYLHGRRQRIRIEESNSVWCSTTAGVPQGGVLSPLLFAIFINGISDNISSSYHLYADDLQIYNQASISDLPHAIHQTNIDLEHILSWSKDHGLRVNPTKTQVIVLGSPRFTSLVDLNALPPIVFNGVHIRWSKCVKKLGVFMDSAMTWKNQLDEVSRKVFASVGSLRRLRNFLPTATKIVLSQSLLLPILDYADSCYTDLTEEQLNKLERLQNVCIRFIFGLRKYDHVSEFRTKLKWLTIRLRRNTHILSLLHSILFNPAYPAYLKERFNFRYESHTRTLRSSHNLRLNIPPHSTKFYGDSFTIQAITLWNDLPLHIRKAPSLASFKRMVKDHFLSV
ncbi:unnamed protein product [Plutella xylostella]|uniref:(diamondback moth) hypothetical protein n=1 Tax=Plutella xylostella TaxID=51655 RepID=A0A8S4FEP3_PLUXY|nr:unnamed protein product [Plutella xylostella]